VDVATKLSAAPTSAASPTNRPPQLADSF
jgi:hypothetical protein